MELDDKTVQAIHFIWARHLRELLVSPETVQPRHITETGSRVRGSGTRDRDKTEAASASASGRARHWRFSSGHRVSGKYGEQKQRVRAEQGKKDRHYSMY
ncbi:hypothetical protein RRG08_012603 [Elysia crispata]|uniref:Uncharacterized protein n=1 Tax=Elysia crispata TaxID=231223 RepID=A0AAE1A9H7_9GAST|nr:hypothetical protein RRG08_012603 [Elysia crispata]